MRLKKFFAVAVLSLSACAAPDFPKGRFCTLVWNEIEDSPGVVNIPLSLQNSYGECIMNDNVDDAVRVSAEELFKKKYVAEHPDYFGQILDWKDQIIRWAKEKWRGR